jgi:hypothetical protein
MRGTGQCDAIETLNVRHEEGNEGEKIGVERGFGGFLVAKLLKRRGQVSVVSCQWSVVSCQFSVVCSQFSALSCLDRAARVVARLEKTRDLGHLLPGIAPVYPLGTFLRRSGFEQRIGLCLEF